MFRYDPTNDLGSPRKPTTISTPTQHNEPSYTGRFGRQKPGSRPGSGNHRTKPTTGGVTPKGGSFDTPMRGTRTPFNPGVVENPIFSNLLGGKDGGSSLSQLFGGKPGY